MGQSHFYMDEFPGFSVRWDVPDEVVDAYIEKTGDEDLINQKEYRIFVQEYMAEKAEYAAELSTSNYQV